MKQFVKKYHPDNTDQKINDDIISNPQWEIQSVTPQYDYGGNEDGHLGYTSMIVLWKNTNKSDDADYQAFTQAKINDDSSDSSDDLPY